MTLASLYLLCWHYDQWKTLLPGFGVYPPVAKSSEPGALTFALTVAAVLGFAGVTGAHLARLRQAPMQKPLLLMLSGASLGVMHLALPAVQVEGERPSC